MAIGESPWFYILRGCSILVILVILLGFPLIPKRWYSTPVVQPNRRPFLVLLALLFLLYVADFASLLVEKLSRGKLPDNTAAFSDAGFFFVLAVEIEFFLSEGD